MAWQEILWCLLLGLATIRALTTAIRKEVESKDVDGFTREQKLILKEDMEHWWMAFGINALLLSAGLVLLFLVPNEVDVTPTWAETYVTYVFILFAALLNIRIERHGYFYRKRNCLNIWGGRVGAEEDKSAVEKRRDAHTAAQDARTVAQDAHTVAQDERDSRQDRRTRRQDKRNEESERE